METDDKASFATKVARNSEGMQLCITLTRDCLLACGETNDHVLRLVPTIKLGKWQSSTDNSYPQRLLISLQESFKGGSTNNRDTNDSTVLTTEGCLACGKDKVMSKACRCI